MDGYKTVVNSIYCIWEKLVEDQFHFVVEYEVVKLRLVKSSKVSPHLRQDNGIRIATNHGEKGTEVTCTISHILFNFLSLQNQSNTTLFKHDVFK